MGYAVLPSGRLHLPEADDPSAVDAVLAAWTARHGGHSLAAGDPAETLADIAWLAAASVTRDGDWIEFSFDEAGDPKWSDSATAFYVAIAPYVRGGTVHIDGEDGSRWSYTYFGGRVTQRGWNGWDASVEPFGEPQVPLPEEPAPRRPGRPAGKVLAGLIVIIVAAFIVVKLFELRT